MEMEIIPSIVIDFKNVIYVAFALTETGFSSKPIGYIAGNRIILLSN